MRRPWPALVAALFVAACSAPLPAPRTGPHLGEQPTTIPYPPPAGKVEIIPPRPPAMQHPVWVDGEWDWTGRRWQWKDGGWRDQALDEYFAPSTVVRASDGTLELFPGAWKKAAPGHDGGRAPIPPAPSP